MALLPKAEDSGNAFEQAFLTWVESGCVDRSELRPKSEAELEDRAASLESKDSGNAFEQVFLTWVEAGCVDRSELRPANDERRGA